MNRRDDHEMRVGFGDTSKKIDVQVPDGDITPWDLDTKFTTVGGDYDRIDAVAKVTGRAKFAYDMNLPGMLYGVLVRSPHAQGRLTKLELDAVKNAPGVQAVVPLKTVEGDQRNRIRYVGDPIAAIAADSYDQAIDAIASIVTAYELDDSAVIDFRDHEDAPALDRDGRVIDAWPEKDADVMEASLNGCAQSATETFSCEVATHSSLETHGCVVDCKDDGSVEIWASTQATFGFAGGIARALGVPRDKVRCHSEYVGGGFGSKFSPGDEGLAAALLSREANKPVKVMLDRFEEHTCSGNRPAAIMQIRAGIAGNGTIKAWDYRSWGAPGFAGRGGSTRWVNGYTTNAQRRNTQRDLSTATDAARAKRAPGWPQGNFALEGMLDLLAQKAGMDPLEFRLHNDVDPIRQAEWKAGAERFGWKDRYNPNPGQPKGDNPRYLRGAGMAASQWGQMGSSGRGSYRSTCRIHQDGTVEARNGAQDIGTGMKTVMAALTAEELGLPLERIRVTMGDTNDPPGPASGGSTTTPSLAPAVRLAASLAKDELRAKVADALGIDADKVECANGKVIADGSEMSFTEACKKIGPNPIETTGRRFNNYDGYQNTVAGCQFAEVEVDTMTGTVKVLRMVAVADCGTVIATKLAESQVIGAMIQGLSYALFENKIMDTRTGRMVNGDFLNYKVASPADMPEFDVIMFPVANGKNNVGAAGLGEPPKVAAPAAVANAISNAIGAPMRSMPFTPDKVLAALTASRKNK